MRRNLNEYRVKLERVKRGEKAVPVNYPKNLGRRTKLGGKPDWIQGDETPECPQCGDTMYFVAQIVFEGARTTAAWNASFYGTVVKVSADGNFGMA